MIFVVEDDSDIRALIVFQLQKAGYQTLEFDTAEKAYDKLKQNHSLCQLLVLDWMLPGISGPELIQQLKLSKIKPPVMMLTARAAPHDEVHGFEVGADEYLAKPFDTKVLLARVKNILNRNRDQSSDIILEKKFSLANLEYFFESCVAQIDKKDIALTPSERKLFETLIQKPGKVYSREFLVGIIQGDGVYVTDRTIDTHMVALRKKLSAWKFPIETVRGVGYRIKTDPIS